ncbi:hypothetical protein Ato02nite_100490 [Paractinoplanes toevensis]|uniref:Uncharacterized protein n=2 Tax=Paractinoplanes toevensis TaxID=571911 RepID=A0A919WDP9_9ACTN|nr:hypothetical protein Ato02nite_100490 [Actinoplanes toevensis]
MVIGWADITSARVRRRGPLATLEITPRDLYGLRVDLPSRDLPRIRYRNGRPVLIIDIGIFNPGPATLRAELNHHIT